MPPITLPLGPALQAAALDWSRIVRNRKRWAALPEGRADQARHSRELLQKLDVDLGAVDLLAEAPTVQVSIPFVSEDVGWEARIFPWEYVLTAAIRGARPKPMLVVRRLIRSGGDGADEQPRTTLPERVLILENAPGALRERYQFESERQVVASGLPHFQVEVLVDAEPDVARAHILDTAPVAIHLSGFDTHQGAQLLGREDERVDGFLMEDSRGVPRDVPAEELAAILNSADRPPQLVACNFRNSAARVAAMAVARGAQAAIGFQDVLDDSFAESLFATFYANWDRRNRATFDAFQATFLELQARPDGLSGSGIVLWMSTDVFALPVTAGPVQPEVLELPSSGLPTETPLGLPVPEPVKQGLVSIAAVTSGIWVDARVHDRINYALLHNNQPLFEVFTIGKGTDEVVPDIEVEVTLYAGGTPFPYRVSLPLVSRSTDLRRQIRVPLTSSLLRSVRESIQSVVYVKVRHGDQTIFQNTFPVSLIPIEEWANDDRDAIWLPSFVLPRDPAVGQIVDRSLGLLRALDDRSRVGFMGYQVVDQTNNDPYLRVDLQVQAIWSTLSFQYDIAYINPPPTYSPHAQRLRSPTEILRSKSGTCIDLSLLLAACLESIDIYSVIVLYAGHANAGYFRGHDLHQAFELLQPSSAGALASVPAGVASGAGGPAPATIAVAPGPGAPPATGSETRDAQTVAWQIRRQSDQSDPMLQELQARVARRELSILDATLLTTRDGFFDAVDLGRRSLDPADQGAGRVFLSLIDLQIARRNAITPLPLVPAQGTKLPRVKGSRR